MFCTGRRSGRAHACVQEEIMYTVMYATARTYQCHVSVVVTCYLSSTCPAHEFWQHPQRPPHRLHPCSTPHLTHTANQKTKLLLCSMPPLTHTAQHKILLYPCSTPHLMHTANQKAKLLLCLMPPLTHTTQHETLLHRESKLLPQYDCQTKSLRKLTFCPPARL